MKRLSFFLIPLLLSGCVASEPGIFEVEDFLIAQVEVEGKEYFFQYPAGASFDKEKAAVGYAGCNINYGVADNQPEFIEFVDLEIKEKTKDGVLYKAFYSDDILVTYTALVLDSNFEFYTGGEEGVSECVGLVENMAESFSDKPIYNGDGFSLYVLPEYEVEHLASGNGLVLKKRMELGDCDLDNEDMEKEVNCGSYGIEIYFMSYLNSMQYENVADLVSKKYQGYSVEFIDHKDGGGVCVNEWSGGDAIRRFFLMSEDAKVIYEAYLQLPSFHYSKHQAEFDEFIREISVN